MQDANLEINGVREEMKGEDKSQELVMTSMMRQILAMLVSGEFILNLWKKNVRRMKNMKQTCSFQDANPTHKIDRTSPITERVMGAAPKIWTLVISDGRLSW